MVNEAYFSVTGFIATQPKMGNTKTGIRTLSMRVGWTPRRIDANTGQWADQPSSFISVQCFRKVAENGSTCLRRGDPVVVKGTLRIREYEDQAGVKRTSVEVLADSIGHDISRGVSHFTRTQTQQEQTAAEYEQAQAAAARDPLPGDRLALESSEGAQMDSADRAELGAGVRAELDPGDRPEAEPGDGRGVEADDDRFDEAEDEDEDHDQDEGFGVGREADRAELIGASR